MNKKYYITTPIYYINADPSVGSACTTLAADVLARYHRLAGEDVFFLTGTDEHGQKVAEVAEKEGLSPIEYCNKIAPRFEEAWKLLHISNDFFIRTTDPRHEKVVGEFLQKIYDNGDIYKAKYEGYYCIGCEAFKTETELVDGHCPLHPPEKTVWKSEENWFFKLSKYVPQIIKLIENDDTNYVFPEGKRREVLAKLKAGVRDTSISRESVSWGIPTPWDPKHTIYVWIDALINYYSATRFVDGKADFWPAELHLLGKEILWFHAVIWQAMLMSAQLPIPRKTYTHSFYTIDGQKMSKSLGNTIPPKEMVETFGVDGARYLLATSFPNINDVDIGVERFKEKYNADLANNLGNLVSRVSKLGQGIKLDHEAFEFNAEYTRLLDELRLDEAISWVFDKWINSSNARINEVSPWKLPADDPVRIDLLRECANNLRLAAYHLKPVMPQTAEKIEKCFEDEIGTAEGALFPRILEEKKVVATKPIVAEKLVVGEVVKLDKHPDADGLQIVDVNIGERQVTVVTHATNLKVGDIVPMVLPGGRVKSAEGKVVKIEKGKLRGVTSFGMLASELELGIGQNHDGIYVLDQSLKDKVGRPLREFIKMQIS